MDSFLYEDTGYRAGSEKDLQVIRAAIKEYVSACQNNSGEILGNIDTVQAAKDLDLFRAVFGQKTLDYLGYSYGTFLGTTYAALFPTKVGRFVLDGAIDPSVSDEDASLNQLIGFDNALKAYMKECLNGLDCPFSGTVEDGLGQLSDYLDQIESAPINSQDGRTVGVGVMLTGLYMTLYSDEYWGYLTQAFNEAIQNEDGTVFIQLADYYNDRKEGGSYASNQYEAFIAINCLDNRSDASPEAQDAQNKRILIATPTLGRFAQNGAEMCAHWPYPVAKRPDSYAAKGSPTIMVIGTTGDPATPYHEAVSLAHDILENGFLVTYNGEGHTAYGRSNECVSSVVDAFLIDGNLPSSEPDC
jgi:pimeloyl-ACP methyl ester carboxylesterase